jgi:hypothetical protein
VVRRTAPHTFRSSTVVRISDPHTFCSVTVVRSPAPHTFCSVVASSCLYAWFCSSWDVPEVASSSFIVWFRPAAVIIFTAVVRRAAPHTFRSSVVVRISHPHTFCSATVVRSPAPHTFCSAIASFCLYAWFCPTWDVVGIDPSSLDVLFCPAWDVTDLVTSYLNVFRPSWDIVPDVLGVAPSLLALRLCFVSIAIVVGLY